MLFLRLYCQVIVVAVVAQKAPQSDFQSGDGQVLATTVTSIAQIPPWVPDGPIQAVTTAGVQNGDGGPNPSFNASPIDDVTKDRWCNRETISCTNLCGGAVKTRVNKCNATDLSYNCVCANCSLPVDSSKHVDTIPNFICEATYQQCLPQQNVTRQCQEACGTLSIPATPSLVTATSAMTRALLPDPTPTSPSQPSPSPNDSAKIGISLGVALGVLAGAITALLSYKHNKQKRHSQLDGASRSTERHLDSSADIVKEGRTTGGTDAEIMSNLREDGLSGCFKKAVSGQCRVGAQELDGEAVLPCPRKFQGSPAASRAELA